MRKKPLYHKILPLGEFKVFSGPPQADQDRLVRTKQIHSKELANYQGKPLDETEADGIVFNYGDIKKRLVAVVTADCLPILFLGKEKGAFLHAGWKGLAADILSHPLLRDIQPTYALIGPGIELESFEVSEDFRGNFSEQEFFHHIDGRLCFDLRAKAAKDIYMAHPEIKLEICREDTFALRKYHSYRRDKTSERNWNIFSL